MTEQRYDLTPLVAPRTAGWALRIATRIVESGVVGDAVAHKVLRDLGIQGLRDEPCDEMLPTVHPIFRSAHSGSAAVARASTPPAPTSASAESPFTTSADFVSAYRSGATTPAEVAERLIRCIKESDEATPKLRSVVSLDPELIREMADAATARYRAGAPLGPLDGVPVGVKDEVDLRGHGTTVGTRFLGGEAAPHDATIVGRLRSAGALLFGKLNMHEIGLGVTGINPHHGTARNPYDRAHMTGGSSSGSGAAIAAGLCPIAVGADGGGSIRIPASLCGVVGLKPTYGRLSEHGAAPLCWSVAHLGPLAASVRDAATAYGVMAGPDPHDPNTAFAPPPRVPNLTDPGLERLRIGYFAPYFHDADPEVVSTCERMVSELEGLGATRVPIQLDRLGLLRIAHSVTIVSEMRTGMAPHLPKHLGDFGHDVRMNLALARRITSADYLKAQRLRERFFAAFMSVLSDVDVIVTPTTACAAPIIRDDALSTGDSNLPLLDRIMRFTPSANLTGLPAISVPVGYTTHGLPIGLQFMGRPWAEARLLEVASAVERLVSLRVPADYCRLLEGGASE